MLICSLLPTIYNLSTVKSIQAVVNEAKKCFFQTAGFSLYSPAKSVKRECPYVSQSLSQMVLWDDVHSLIISEVPHNDIIHKMTECL